MRLHPDGLLTRTVIRRVVVRLLRLFTSTPCEACGRAIREGWGAFELAGDDIVITCGHCDEAKAVDLDARITEFERKKREELMHHVSVTLIERVSPESCTDDWSKVTCGSCLKSRPR